jgi:hypothetical protein
MKLMNKNSSDHAFKISIGHVILFTILTVVFSSIISIPFESPDEIFHLTKIAVDGSLDAQLLSGLNEMVGQINDDFSFASNKCFYLHSKPSIGYFIFRAKYSIFPILLISGLSWKFGFSSLMYFLWPSTFYYCIQANPDIAQIAISSLILSVPLYVSGILFVCDGLFYDKSAICGLTFVLIYAIARRIPPAKINYLIIASIGLSIFLEILRYTLSTYLGSLASYSSDDKSQSTEIENIINGNQDYGQNTINQILSLMSSILFLGGSASFYPTPIFYIVFVKLLWSWAHEFKLSNYDLYQTRKQELKVAISTLAIAFFSLRILLPPVGTARYWSIIIPFILSFVGAAQKINQRQVILGLTVLTIIANLWMYCVWTLTC